MTTGPKRILQPNQERTMGIARLCAVSPEYLAGVFGVSTAYSSLLLSPERSSEWSDELSEFYRRTNIQDRQRNGIHMYLGFETDGSPDKGVLDKKRDQPAYELVKEGLFMPLEREVIQETGLVRILGAKAKNLSKDEQLIEAIFGEANKAERTLARARDLVRPYVETRLLNAYQNSKRVDLKGIYGQVAQDVYDQLSHGLTLVRNPRIVEYERKMDEELESQVKEMLSKLTPREEGIIRMRFGVGLESDLEEVTSDFSATRERIRGIEAKALRKLRHPGRSRKLRAFLDGKLE